MEIAIVAKAKQGYIYRYMVEHKMSACQLAEEIGMSSAQLGRLINFQWYPKKTGRRCESLDKIEKYFKIPIEMLFPPEISEEILTRLGKKQVIIQEVEMLRLESVSQKQLIYKQTSENDVCDVVEDVLKELNPREEKVLRLLFGISE